MTIRNATSVAVQTALVSLASYLCGFYFTALFHSASAPIGGLWAAISGIVVLQATRRETWSTASLRILGTFIGSILSAAYLSLLPFSPIGMAGCIFATVLVCHAVRVPDHARLGASTVAVIMVVASSDPTLNAILSASLRFSESCIGTAMAVLTVLMRPGSKGAAQPDGAGDER
jgi:uncharacterized membrane protein YgaE (UPF0421/DUF939 family)